MEESQAARLLLLERLFDTQEEKRRRIVCELQNGAGQLLATLLVGLQGLGDSETLEEAKTEAHRLRRIASQAVEGVARLARELYPALLEDYGLGMASRRYIADYEQIHGIAVAVTADVLDTIDLPPAIQLGVYRILQEALTTVARHSQTKAVGILFARSGPALQVTVSDDDCGFETSMANAISLSHPGLHSMREKAAMLGGTVSLRSNGTGRKILFYIPLERPESRAPQRPGRPTGASPFKRHPVPDYI